MWLDHCKQNFFPENIDQLSILKCQKCADVCLPYSQSSPALSFLFLFFGGAPPPATASSSSLYRRNRFPSATCGLDIRNTRLIQTPMSGIRGHLYHPPPPALCHQKWFPTTICGPDIGNTWLIQTPMCGFRGTQIYLLQLIQQEAVTLRHLQSRHGEPRASSRQIRLVFGVTLIQHLIHLLIPPEPVTLRHLRSRRREHQGHHLDTLVWCQGSPRYNTSSSLKRQIQLPLGTCNTRLIQTHFSGIRHHLYQKPPQAYTVPLEPVTLRYVRSRYKEHQAHLDTHGVPCLCQGVQGSSRTNASSSLQQNRVPYGTCCRAPAHLDFCFWYDSSSTPSSSQAKLDTYSLAITMLPESLESRHENVVRNLPDRRKALDTCILDTRTNAPYSGTVSSHTKYVCTLCTVNTCLCIFRGKTRGDGRIICLHICRSQKHCTVSRYLPLVIQEYSKLVHGTEIILDTVCSLRIQSTT